jgi:hypothetical protein
MSKVYSPRTPADRRRLRQNAISTSDLINEAVGLINEAVTQLFT